MIDYTGTDIRPIEETDPDIADLIYDICHDRQYGVKEIYTDKTGNILFIPCPIVSMGKTGRNDPCSCGSGKKYKKCCG